MVYTGFHAIEERLRTAAATEGDAHELCILYSKIGPRIKKILALASGLKIECKQASDSELDVLVKQLPVSARDHRGIVLCANEEKLHSCGDVNFEQWILDHENKQCSVVVLDSITDPHNVGAILRSCDQFGVSLVILPPRRGTQNVKESDVIARSSAGASSWVSVLTVKNLFQAVVRLKKAGFWVYGADVKGEPLYRQSFDRKSVIILGSEGQGIAHLLRNECDMLVSIPTCGKIESLNVSVAAGVFLYEMQRQRSFT